MVACCTCLFEDYDVLLTHLNNTDTLHITSIGAGLLLVILYKISTFELTLVVQQRGFWSPSTAPSLCDVWSGRNTCPRTCFSYIQSRYFLYVSFLLCHRYIFQRNRHRNLYNLSSSRKDGCVSRNAKVGIMLWFRPLGSQ